MRRIFEFFNHFPKILLQPQSIHSKLRLRLRFPPKIKVNAEIYSKAICHNLNLAADYIFNRTGKTTIIVKILGFMGITQEPLIEAIENDMILLYSQLEIYSPGNDLLPLIRKTGRPYSLTPEFIAKYSDPHGSGFEQYVGELANAAEKLSPEDSRQKDWINHLVITTRENLERMAERREQLMLKVQNSN